MNRWRSLLGRVREFNATQTELHERLIVLNRPWEEEYLHWSWNGHQWQLHGREAPPAGRRRSTTSQGWCPYAGCPSSSESFD